MLNTVRSVIYCNTRTFKNFGHKKQPIPGVTMLWHGFLTLTFIGLGLEWESITKLLFGDDDTSKEVPFMGKKSVDS